MGRIALERLLLGAAVVAMSVGTGCRRRSSILATQVTEYEQATAQEDEPTRRQSLLAEVVDGYERGNDPFSLEIGDYVGIGVTPRDAWGQPEDFGFPFPEAGRGYSNRFESGFSSDGNAAWVFDEVSWRVDVCGRPLPVPLRYAAVLRRDGDRWYPLMQHLSLAERHPDRRVPSDAVDVEAIRRAVAARPGRASSLPDDLLGRLLLSPGELSQVLAVGPTVTRGTYLTVEQLRRWLALLSSGVVLEGAGQERLAMPDIGGATRAQLGYWTGAIEVEAADAGQVLVGQDVEPVTLPSDGPGDSARRLVLRVSLVFEVLGGEVSLRLVHISLPTSLERLARTTFGSALLATTPLELLCP